MRDAARSMANPQNSFDRGRPQRLTQGAGAHHAGSDEGSPLVMSMANR